ncbi:MAG: hypothetical protein WKF77_32090, partial [Planctomycetaceae bacterium]
RSKVHHVTIPVAHPARPIAASEVSGFEAPIDSLDSATLALQRPTIEDLKPRNVQENNLSLSRPPFFVQSLRT